MAAVAQDTLGAAGMNSRAASCPKRPVEVSCPHEASVPVGLGQYPITSAPLGRGSAPCRRCDCLGVGDIAVDHRSKDLVWDYTAHLNRSGIRAFPRGFGGDPWRNEQHIHWGSRENYDHAHPHLQAQIREMEGLLRRVDVASQYSLLDADDAWMRQPMKSGVASSMCVIDFLASDTRVRSGRDRCGLVPKVLRRGDGR